MNENFDRCFELVIGHEGGFTKGRKDRGNWTSGKVGTGQCKGTKFGVSAMAYPLLDIENLTLDDAKAIYLRDYWNRIRGDDLPSGLDYLIFDMAVNHGTGTAATLLQEAIGAVPDGDIGPRTLDRVKGREVQVMIKEVAARRMAFYAKIKTFKEFGLGWSRRTMDSLITAYGHAVSIASPLDNPKEESFMSTWFRRV